MSLPWDYAVANPCFLAGIVAVVKPQLPKHWHRPAISRCSMCQGLKDRKRTKFMEGGIEKRNWMRLSLLFLPGNQGRLLNKLNGLVIVSIEERSLRPMLMQRQPLRAMKRRHCL